MRAKSELTDNYVFSLFDALLATRCVITVSLQNQNSVLSSAIDPLQ